MTILLDPDSGAPTGGTPNTAPAPAAPAPASAPAPAPAAPLLSGTTSSAPDWKASLPDDIKSEGSLASIKSVADLAKGYVHAQRLVGTDKMPAPSDKWTEAQWNEHWERLGRPKTADEYTVPEIKVGDKTIGKEQLKDALGVFHQLGINSKQAEGILKFYGETAAKAEAERSASMNVTRDTALADLQKEWGVNLNAKLDTARAALQKFGDDSAIKFFTESGLGNHPAVIRMLAKIGDSVSEDSASGNGVGLQLQSATTAAQEIQRLRGDREFMAAWGDREHPGHKAALEKWSRLHQTAYNTAG